MKTKIIIFSVTHALFFFATFSTLIIFPCPPDMVAPQGNRVSPLTVVTCMVAIWTVSG